MSTTLVGEKTMGADLVLQSLESWDKATSQTKDDYIHLLGNSHVNQLQTRKEKPIAGLFVEPTIKYKKSTHFTKGSSTKKSSMEAWLILLLVLLAGITVLNLIDYTKGAMEWINCCY